jgi:peptidoglycan/LPS O-acetylase OafA/YrhL
MSSHRAEFRSDLEGLRGVAILLVVLFHAGVPGLRGGFVGVDVFFVLSGFFITGLLARELAASGRVDLPAFYGRRALRVLPTLLVVLFATLLAVMWLYAPIDRAAIAGSARAVALSSGNLEFARDAVDYFSSGDNPLLHTWSLAVEEQFYLVWPLLLLLLALVAKRRSVDAASTTDGGMDGRADTTLLVGIAIVGALSFLASLWLTSASQPWAFFGMPTRIWEFALGGALAIVLSKRAGPGAAGTVLQLAGLVAITFAVVTYDRTIPYPGAAALLPALGTVALVAGGHGVGDSAIGSQLAASAFRWFGRLSYAWYLWHWPLVGLGAVLHPEIGVWGRLGWSLGALGLAWATYWFVERSAREGRLSRVSASWLPTAAVMVSVIAALAAHGATLVAERRVLRPDQQPFAAAREDRMQHDCWASTVHENAGPCEFGDTRSSTTVALFGDSHAEHWLAALDRIGRERGWKIVAMVKGGCPVAETPDLGIARHAQHSRECVRYREAMIRRIIALRPAAAILSSWDHYVSRDGSASHWQVTSDSWRVGLRKTYARLSAAGIATVAIRGTPRTWFDVPSCLSRRAANLLFARDCTYEREGSFSHAAVDAQTEAAQGLRVRFVDLNDQICPAPRCGVVRNGIVVFTDDNHLTASFSRSVAPLFATRLDRALGELGVELR